MNSEQLSQALITRPGFYDQTANRLDFWRDRVDLTIAWPREAYEQVMKGYAQLHQPSPPHRLVSLLKMNLNGDELL